MGSPIRFLYDGIQNQSYDYDEFGFCSQSSSEALQPFGFTGYQRDIETSLYFAQARYYDSFNGRFVQEDSFKGTLSDIRTLNQYIYCIQNPLTFVDLQGYWPTWKEIGDGIANTADKVFNSKPWKVISTTGGLVVGVISTIGGVAGIVGSFEMAPATGGLTLKAVPISVGGVIHGVNSVGNAVRDYNHMFKGDWDRVGTENFLKDHGYVWAGGKIGGVIGGEQGKENGEFIGKMFYFGADIFFSFATIKEGIETLTHGTLFNITHEVQIAGGGANKITEHIFVKDEITALTRILEKIKIGLNLKTLIMDDLIPLLEPVFGSLLGSSNQQTQDLVWK